MQTNDSLSVTESVKVTLVSNLSTFDVIATTRLVPDSFEQQTFGGFAGFSFAQSYFADGPNDSRENNDTVTLLSIASVAVDQAVQASESTVLELPVQATESENVTVSESVGRQLDSFVSRSESITASESTQILVPVLLVQIAEQISVNEPSFVQIPQNDLLIVIVQDSIKASETEGAIIPELYITVAEQVSTGELVQLMMAVFVLTSQTVGAGELTIASAEVSVNENDTVSVNDAISIFKVFSIEVYENVLVSETNIDRLDSHILVEDQIQLADSPLLSAASTYIPRMTLLGVG